MKGTVERRQRLSPGLSRFRQLVSRALFELQLAADVARAEGLAPDVTSLVEGSKRNLRACLERAQRAAPVPHMTDGEG